MAGWADSNECPLRSRWAHDSPALDLFPTHGDGLGRWAREVGYGLGLWALSYGAPVEWISHSRLSQIDRLNVKRLSDLSLPQPKDLSHPQPPLPPRPPLPASTFFP
jgi:hypothetical protein